MTVEQSTTSETAGDCGQSAIKHQQAQHTFQPRWTRLVLLVASVVGFGNGRGVTCTGVASMNHFRSSDHCATR